MPKQIAVILGMHRSGTSLITKSIELLGYSLGDNLMPPGPDNPKGFFEDLDIVAFNDKLLAHLYSAWDTPLNVIDRLEVSDDGLEAEARALLDRKLKQSDRLVIKDPRMSILMGFWAARFAELNIDARYVSVYRNPLDVAASLEARNGIEISHGLLLCYFYNLAQLLHLKEDLFIVDYNRFLGDPETQFARIAARLDVKVDPKAFAEFKSEFVDESLRHHSSQDPENDDRVMEPMVRLSQLMDALSVDGEVSVAKEVEALQREGTSAAGFEFLKFQSRIDFDRKRRLEIEFEERESYWQEHIAGQLAERAAYISKLDEQIAHLERSLAVRDQLIEERGKKLALANERLVASEEVMNRQGDKITALSGTIADLNEDIEARLAEVGEYQKHLENFDRIHRDVLSSVSFRLGRMLTYPIRKPFSLFVLPRLARSPRALVVVGFLRTCMARPLAALKLVSPARIRNFYLLLTSRQELIEEVIGNYQEVMGAEPESSAVHAVHHFTEEELAGLSLSFPVEENPRVSVIIPVYDQLDHTLHCLQSIARHMPSAPVEIIVADDCSTDRTEAVMSGIRGIRYVRHPKNLGFLRSCNRAVDFASGEFIFLLNNDTAVRPGWLDRLVETFEHEADAGIVGSRLVFPDGRVQEAGGIIWKDATGWNYGRNQDPDLPELNYLKEVDYVSGAALMCGADLFRDLGKFDETFAPAYYEDTDLAFRVREKGFKVYVQPRSEIVHYEGISHGNDMAQGVKQHQLLNQEKFRQKWLDVLQGSHFDNATNVMVARERSAGKTTVLVIDHYVPHFDKDAGSRSTYLYLKLLVESGCNVKFMGDNFFRHEPYTSELQSLGIEVLYGHRYEKGWRTWLSENPEYVDIVYMMRPHIAEKYIDFVNSLDPKPKTIYFGHDLHYLRLQRQSEVDGTEKLAAEAERWKRKEFALFEKFDLIYYPSEVEVAEIRAVRPDLPVKAIPLYAFDGFNRKPVDFSERADLLFVGGFNHPPNVDGLLWFVRDVFPKVLEELPEIKLHVVGSNTPDIIRDCAFENLLIEGFLPDEMLDDLYGKVRLSLVPLRFGAGIKGKVLEAMDKGVPVVTTEIGAEGIPKSADAMIVTSDVDEMAAQIVSIYGDEERLSQLSACGRKVVQEFFSKEAVRRVIADDFHI